MMSSTDIYWTEKTSFGIPSLTLAPTGLERSSIRRHLPGWCFFGMTPKRLVWRLGRGGDRERAGYPPSIQFILQVRVNNRRLKQGRGHVTCGRFEWDRWRVEPQMETIAKTRNNIGHLGLVRVATELELHLVHSDGRNFGWEMERREMILQRRRSRRRSATREKWSAWRNHCLVRHFCCGGLNTEWDGWCGKRNFCGGAAGVDTLLWPRTGTSYTRRQKERMGTLNGWKGAWRTGGWTTETKRTRKWITGSRLAETWENKQITGTWRTRAQSV